MSEEEQIVSFVTDQYTTVANEQTGLIQDAVLIGARVLDINEDGSSSLMLLVGGLEFGPIENVHPGENPGQWTDVQELK